MDEYGLAWYVDPVPPGSLGLLVVAGLGVLMRNGRKP